MFKSLGLTWSAANVLNGRQYAASGYLSTWDDADVACDADEATLASVLSAEEDGFLRERFTDPSAP